MNQRAVLVGWFACLTFCLSAVTEARPARVVLVIVDGLHMDAPERLELDTFAELAAGGTRVRKVVGIVPYHPTYGEYASIHTSSYPNPMMMAGTIFLRANQPMLQHSFDISAFVANSRSYQSITDGYEFTVQKTETDEYAVDRALELLSSHDIDFLRLHLQNTGNGGSETLEAPPDAPYRHDIWHKDSPYVAKAREADRQVGRLIDGLEHMGKWEDTLFVLTSDHGQTRSGWHPTLPEESWMFPAVFYGPGIRKGQTIEWADQTDLVPTIAQVMDVPIPNTDGGAGKVLSDALQVSASGSGKASGASAIIELNRVLARYIQAEAEMIVGSSDRPYLNSLAMGFESDFYGLRRVMDWEELGSTYALTAQNLEVVEAMEQALASH